MRNLGFIAAFGTLAIVAALVAPIARASRVALLPEVEVRGGSIFLSDLLPPNVPAAMRDSAQSILIGLAPQPGSTRILDGGKIADLIGAASNAREIDIPRQIVVRRLCRVITREEVVTAIREAFQHSGLPDADVQPDDLRVFPSVMVSSNDARLKVHRVDFDDTLNQAKFLMSERGSLPFLVTAQLRDSRLIQAVTQDGASIRGATQDAVSRSAVPLSAALDSQQIVSSSATGDTRLQRLASGALVNATLVQGPTLVPAGKAATLYLNSGTMQMLLDVTAIDRGSLHQVVRVRLPGTGKVLHAEVVGDRRLEATF